jgi:hypothetical protein
MGALGGDRRGRGERAVRDNSDPLVFGIPLGITPDVLHMTQSTPGMLSVGLGFALAGGIRTHGPVRRWGEVYPRWLWLRAGGACRRGGAGGIRGDHPDSGWADELPAPVRLDSWVNVPSMLWVVWGGALGAAAYAYYLRRRSECRRCAGRQVEMTVSGPSSAVGGSKPSKY